MTTVTYEDGKPEKIKQDRGPITLHADCESSIANVYSIETRDVDSESMTAVVDAAMLNVAMDKIEELPFVDEAAIGLLNNPRDEQ